MRERGLVFTRNKKLLSVVLSVLMTLSFLFQGGVVAPSYAGEVGNNIITNASISKIDGSPMTGTIGAWQAFRINVDYKLPNNIVHEGDTSTITLPAGIVSASPSTFQIKYGSNIVANGKLVDGNPTKVILTYTKYVEGKSDLEGKFFINAQIDNKVHNTEKTISVDLSNNGETVHAGNLNYKPKIINLLPILKAGWMWSQDSTVGIYQIKINQKNEAFVNAKVVDELLDSTASYLPDKMTIYEGKWESTYGGTGLELKDKKDVTNQYKDKITYNGSKFTLDIGSSPEGKGLLIEYRVKIPYKPIAGEKFKNKATFTNNNKEYSHGVTYQIMEAGGSGEGYTYSLEINKKDPSGNSLQGAKFDIIRVRSGQVVGKVETDANGYAKIGGLLHDDYLIHETEAPKGYGLAEDMNVAATDFDSTTKTVKKTIIDKKESISIPVTKKWVGPEGISATVRLFAGNSEVGSVTLNKANNWKHTFADLEKYKDGKEIKYTVKEDAIANYKSEISGDAASGFTVKNTNTEKVTVPVEKKWVGKSANKVEVKLLADGTEKESADLTAADSWKHEFKNLPKYDSADGHEIVYTIKEVKISGYNTVISGTAKDGFTITNTITGKVSIPVTKKWVGPEGTSATIRLFADNSEVGSVTLNKANNWKHTFANLEKYKDGKEIKYTVKEDSIANYNTKITGDMASGFTVTNTNVEKTKVNVTKKWVGKAKDSVKVKLIADGTEKQEATLSAATNWKHEFDKLAKYDEADGHKITYTIKEVSIDGYKSVISGTAKDGFTITNTITGKVSIPVTKKWVGPEGTSATIRLFADNSEVGSVTLNKANNWKHTFANLEKYKDGKEIKYTVKEDSIANYNTKITGDMASGFTVTNTNVEKTKVNVTKKWVGKAKDSVKVKLIADGTEKQEATLSAATNWKHEFDKLAKYDEADGHKITYTIKEVSIDGYKSVIGGSAEEGFTITNTEENPKIPNKPKSPNTGDSSNVTLYGYILVSSILALLVLIAIRKKHI